MVAADEPYAATAGRDVLGNGGSAADAAVAMYFTMAVTLPSRAGLGGGGVCIAFDRQEEQAQVIDFLPRITPSGGVLPGNPRGMAVLHAQYGSQRWQYLLGRAANLSRFGAKYSRAFVRDFDAGLAKVKADPGTAKILLQAGGGLPREGDPLEQVELSTVIAGIRKEGAGYFYAGGFAARFAEAASRVGGKLTTDDVRGYTPRLTEAVTVPVGDHTAFFAPPPAYGGTAGALIWSLLTEVSSYGSAEAGQRATLLAAASQTALRPMPGLNGSAGKIDGVFDQSSLQRLLAAYQPERSAGPAQATEGASFVAADQWGNAVACSFTMNGLFGSGRTAPGTGVLLAAPDRSAPGPSSPVIVGNENTGELYFAAAAGSGSQDVTALARIMLAGLAEEKPLSEAMSLPRFHGVGAGGTVWVEDKLAPAARSALSRQGLVPTPIERLGRVNAVICSKGLRRDPELCETATDPRGWGLARRAQ